MGNTIVNWSPIHGQGATTSNTVALASVFALEQPYRSLLTHTQASYSTMETMYEKGDNGAFQDSGVQALERLVKSNMLKPEAVSDYTETIYKASLDFLPASRESKDEKETERLIKTILKAASARYDFLWIDAHSGTANSRTTEMLKQADLVLVHLPQNKFILEQFFRGGMPEELQGKPYFIVLSQYDEDAGYSLRNIKRQFQIQVPLFSIPYTTGFRDAANQERVSEYFVRSFNAQKGDAAYGLFQATRRINTAILKELGYAGMEASQA